MLREDVNRFKCALAWVIVGLAAAVFADGGDSDRTYLWPEGKIPHAQAHQKTAPHLRWYRPPHRPNGACVILISGGGYGQLSDLPLLERWNTKLTERGFQCVSLIYRTPGTKGGNLPRYQAAWDDGQRAVRVVKRDAKERGYDPAKIGAMGMSAGAHLTALLAVNSTVKAYDRVDDLDDTPCNIAFAITGAIAYGLKDEQSKDLGNLELGDYWAFDRFAPPMCMMHGDQDPYSCRHSMAFDRKLREKGVYSEFHLMPGRGHGFWGNENLPRADRQPHDRWWEIVEAFLVGRKFCEKGVDDPLKLPATVPAGDLKIKADTVISGDERRCKGRIHFYSGALTLEKMRRWPVGSFVILMGGRDFAMNDVHCNLGGRAFSNSGTNSLCWTAVDTSGRFGDRAPGNQLGKSAKLDFRNSDIEQFLDAGQCGGEIRLDDSRLVLAAAKDAELDGFHTLRLAGRSTLLHVDVPFALQRALVFDVPEGGYVHSAALQVKTRLKLEQGLKIGVDATKVKPGVYPLVRAGSYSLPEAGLAAFSAAVRAPAGCKARLELSGEFINLVVR